MRDGVFGPEKASRFSSGVSLSLGLRKRRMGDLFLSDQDLFPLLHVLRSLPRLKRRKILSAFFVFAVINKGGGIEETRSSPEIRHTPNYN